MNTLIKIRYALLYILIGMVSWIILANHDYSGFECFVGAVLCPYILIETPRVLFGK